MRCFSFWNLSHSVAPFRARKSYSLSLPTFLTFVWALHSFLRRKYRFFSLLFFPCARVIQQEESIFLMARCLHSPSNLHSYIRLLLARALLYARYSSHSCIRVPSFFSTAMVAFLFLSLAYLTPPRSEYPFWHFFLFPRSLTRSLFNTTRQQLFIYIFHSAPILYFDAFPLILALFSPRVPPFIRLYSNSWQPWLFSFRPMAIYFFLACSFGIFPHLTVILAIHCY